MDNVVELLLRKTLNRFELERRLVTAATVVASVEGAEVVVVVVVTVVRALAPKRRPVLGSRLDGITLKKKKIKSSTRVMERCCPARTVSYSILVRTFRKLALV